MPCIAGRLRTADFRYTGRHNQFAFYCFSMLWMFFVIFNYLQEVNLIKVNPTAWEMSLVEDCNRGLRAEKLRRQQATLDDYPVFGQE